MIYCKNCKYHAQPSSGSHMCNHAPHWVSTAINRYRQREYCVDKNVNNDCPFFRSTLSAWLKALWHDFVTPTVYDGGKSL